MSTYQLAVHDFVGQIVGEYQVEHVLDTGQTTVRYLARHLERKYPVAITMYVFPEALSHQARDRFMARFTQIASKLITLRHMHLLPVYDYGEYLGAPYVVTAAGIGESLAHVLKRQAPCTAHFAMQILKQIAEGLEYAHQHDIIHGALKPESILFSTPQTVQVAGCGLTQIVALQGIEQSDHPYVHLMTITGTFLGTPESVAPEYVQGHIADARADVYGLGMVLFELLSGKPPFRGTDPFLTAMARLQLSVPSLHVLRPDLPPEIDQIISHALARDPAQRYQRVSDLVVACSQILVDQGEYSAPLKTVGPFSNDASSSLDWVEKAPTSTGSGQIAAGGKSTIQAREIPPVSIISSIQVPTESGMPLQEEEVQLFDVSFQGLDHLQYTVHAHVTRPRNRPERTAVLPPHVTSPRNQPERTTVLPQSHQLAHVLDQPEKMTDPLLAIPASVPSQAENDEASSNSFLLRIVQPGLVGLMDGSVSTLAPIFATAFATHRPLTTFLVGMASATGAGISMAFAEALSDDGELTGRGNALLRGGITGLMTFLSGAGHTLPFLIPDIHLALIFAYVVVAVELIAIAGIRYKFFNTSWWLSLLQVVGGGLLVFLAAMLFGNG